MSITIDFSDIAQRVRDAAIFLIADNRYVQYAASGNHFTLAPSWFEAGKSEIKKSRYPFRLFWLRFAIGLEYLAKAALIKQQINIFSQNNDAAFASGPLISASANTWLDGILQKEDIRFVQQLSTGTIGKLYNGRFDELAKRGLISQDELHKLNAGYRQLAGFRRNPDVHFYFKQNTLQENGDLEKVYIPLANLVLDIYDRSDP